MTAESTVGAGHLLFLSYFSSGEWYTNYSLDLANSEKGI
jgi:hypothetical protein